MRNGLADVLYIRRQIPLPETADELGAAARHGERGRMMAISPRPKSPASSSTPIGLILSACDTTAGQASNAEA